jgi:hypothetical protein
MPEDKDKPVTGPGAGPDITPKANKPTEKAPEPPAMAAASDSPPVPADPMERLASILERAVTSRPSSGPSFATPGLSEAPVPGGMYMIRGRRVNANNREIDEKGNILHPEELQLDPFGKLI